MQKHIPVLLDSILDELGDINGKSVIDATFGAGGYSLAFLQSGANVTAFDRDENVLPDVRSIKNEFGNQFHFIHDSFSNISKLNDKYDVIVFDLGISSMQIDNPERGFSFRFDAPLDMRMSNSGDSAIDLIAKTSVDELANILRKYGDISKSNILAHAIHDAQPKTTFELKELIYNPRDIAPVFQAIRIAVNNEMGELETALKHVPNLLNMAGKCIIVTFHSIEDRLVKNTFADWSSCAGNPKMPIVCEPNFRLLKTKTPNKTELEHNTRSHSAHMRGVQKIKD